MALINQALLINSPRINKTDLMLHSQLVYPTKGDNQILQIQPNI